MIAAVLCGGKGTRLRSVIGPHQKCAVDVGGRPWIHRVLDAIEAGGVNETVLLTGYKAEEMNGAAASWRKAHRGRMRVKACRSPPAGPDAALELFFSRYPGPAFFFNGDTMIPGFDLAAFMRECSAERYQDVIVQAPSMTDSEILLADAGVFYFSRGCTGFAEVHNTRKPFLDIGSPKGLAVARRRFSE